MNEHEHAANDETAPKPTQDEVAKKAYAFMRRKAVRKDMPSRIGRMRKSNCSMAAPPALSSRSTRPSTRMRIRAIRITMPTWRRISASGSGSRWS